MKFLNNVPDTHLELVQLDAHDDKFMELFLINIGAELIDADARTYQVMRCHQDHEPDHFTPENHDETVGCGIRHCMIQWEHYNGRDESPSMAYLYEHVNQSIITTEWIVRMYLSRDGVEVQVFLDYSMFYLDHSRYISIPLGIQENIFEVFQEYETAINKMPPSHPLRSARAFFDTDYTEWKIKNNKE